MLAPGASVLAAHEMGSGDSFGSSIEMPWIGTLPVFVTVNEYEIVSPASVIPEWFTSTGVPAVFTRCNVAFGWPTGTVTVLGGLVTAPPPGPVPFAVAVFLT